MDAFGDDEFVSGSAEVDPAAEFLAREQDQLAGLEDELEPISSAPNPLPEELSDSSPQETSVLEEFSAPNEDSYEFVESSNNDLDLFESELESKPEEVNGYEEPAASVSPKVAKEEPEKIRKWREEQKQRLEEKDAAEAEAIEKLRLQAREELDEWYKNHNEAKTKTKAANRNAEKQFVAATDEIEPGTEWERIAKLCDFNPKSSKGCKDVTRMRSIILQLKQTPLPSKS
ncbi:clathrin light chain isoform X2 [Neocloeon triangulifer]|uniref:clathrin light chain isoform X2 n=1 Tax=Neocloeon triangulifer TaxID=2078957 RepID=UPI00286F090D|nr:clathrin light chain isoform X2 [Neocloeon triangulifer]